MNFKKIFSGFKYFWLIVNICLFLLSIYALINSYVSYKYEVEVLSPPLSEALKVRMKWISDQITLSKIFVIIFGVNSLYIFFTILKPKNNNLINRI